MTTSKTNIAISEHLGSIAIGFLLFLGCFASISYLNKISITHDSSLYSSTEITVPSGVTALSTEPPLALVIAPSFFLWIYTAFPALFIPSLLNTYKYFFPEPFIKIIHQRNSEVP